MARPWGSAGAGGPALGPRDGKGPAGGRCGGNEGYSGMRESSRSEAPAGSHPAGIFGGSIPGQSKAPLGPPPAEHPWWLLTRWHQTPALRRGRWVRAPCPWGPQGERGVLCGELEKGGWGARGKAPHRPELLRNRDKGWATRHRLSPACFVHPDKEGAWPRSNPEPRRKGAAGLPPAILGKKRTRERGNGSTSLQQAEHCSAQALSTWGSQGGAGEGSVGPVPATQGGGTRGAALHPSRVQAAMVWVLPRGLQ